LHDSFIRNKMYLGAKICTRSLPNRVL